MVFSHIVLTDLTRPLAERGSAFRYHKPAAPAATVKTLVGNQRTEFSDFVAETTNRIRLRLESGYGNAYDYDDAGSYIAPYVARLPGSRGYLAVVADIVAGAIGETHVFADVFPTFEGAQVAARTRAKRWAMWYFGGPDFAVIADPSLIQPEPDNGNDEETMDGIPLDEFRRTVSPTACAFLADMLDEGAADDIWFTDDDYTYLEDDEESYSARVERTQDAMNAAAAILRKLGRLEA